MKIPALRLTTLLCLVGGAWAQTLPTDDSAQVTRLLTTARSDIRIVAPSIRSVAIAKALHHAALVRGVQVYILAEGRGPRPEAWIANEPASFIASLSAIRNVQVRITSGINTSPRAVVDGKLLIMGNLLADLAQAPGDTARTLGAPAAADEALRFDSIWRAAPPYLNRMCQASHAAIATRPTTVPNYIRVLCRPK